MHYVYRTNVGQHLAQGHAYPCNTPCRTQNSGKHCDQIPLHQCFKHMYMCPSEKINLKDIREGKNLDLTKLTFLYLPQSKTKVTGLIGNLSFLHWWTAKVFSKSWNIHKYKMNKSKIIFINERTRKMLDKFKRRSGTALIYTNAEINLPIYETIF